MRAARPAALLESDTDARPLLDPPPLPDTPCIPPLPRLAPARLYPPSASHTHQHTHRFSQVVRLPHPPLSLPFPPYSPARYPSPRLVACPARETGSPRSTRALQVLGRRSFLFCTSLPYFLTIRPAFRFDPTLAPARPWTVAKPPPSSSRTGLLSATSRAQHPPRGRSSPPPTWPQTPDTPSPSPPSRPAPRTPARGRTTPRDYPTHGRPGRAS